MVDDVFRYIEKLIMIRICVLGNIGSGKSFVAEQFCCPVFNADKEVNKIYKTDKKCFIKLKSKLPNYVKTFPIKKQDLIKAISDKAKNLREISLIVHPLVRKKLTMFLKTNKMKKIVILDIPLLIENKLNKKKDVLLYVNSSNSNIIKRLKKRKNYKKKITKTLIKNQSLLLKKRKLANYIIENNSSPNIMKKKIRDLKKKILNERDSS
tara:strand:- start:157 stop:783 length:627 start_codon:yes stop_codon:yes gene_type:complete